MKHTFTCIVSNRTRKAENSSCPNTGSPCEDAFFINEDKLCCAISDGLGQGTLRADVWATYLVRHFCENPDINAGNWQEWLQLLQTKWRRSMEKYCELYAKLMPHPDIQRRRWIKSFMSKYQNGWPAKATFIGLQIIQNIMKVTAVGNSCLFIINGNNSLDYLPIDIRHKLIDGYTEGFSSRDTRDSPIFRDYPFPAVEKLYCMLATDALTKWILKAYENDTVTFFNNVFPRLLSLSSKDKFQDFVNEIRTRGLEDDDVALVIIKVSRQCDETRKIPVLKMDKEDNILGSSDAGLKSEPELKQPTFQRFINHFRKSSFIKRSICETLLSGRKRGKL